MKSKKTDKSNDKQPTKTNKECKHKQQRRRGNSNDKRSKMNDQYVMKDHLKNEFSKKLETSKEPPTILIELSLRQWHRLKPNSIHLSDVSIVNSDKKNVLHNKVYYNSIEYGSNIQLQENNFKSRNFKMKDTKSFVTSTILNYPTIKDKMMIFTTDIDCL